MLEQYTESMIADGGPGRWYECPECHAEHDQSAYAGSLDNSGGLLCRTCGQHFNAIVNLVREED